MAEISPFKGVRYNPAAAGSLEKLISPPYDVIAEPQLRGLCARSPHNFTRLILSYKLNTQKEQGFQDAADNLQNWLRNGILQQDSSPAIYRTCVHYRVHGEEKAFRGIIALVRLHPYDERVVLPHEKTLKGPKEDLIRLMHHTRANLDSIWMLYEDNQARAREALANADWESVYPPTDDGQGTKYSLEVCSQPEVIRAFGQAMASQQLTIADGHHRYETALEYARMHGGSNPACQWVLATLTWTDDPGLTVLPTHRVVRGLDESLAASLPEKMARIFRMEKIAPDNVANTLAAIEEPGFVLRTPQEAWRVEADASEGGIGAEPVQNRVLSALLGFDIANLKTDPRIAYMEDLELASRAVDSGEYQAAFLLKPVQVRCITRYASQMKTMPQKSTYFYPKLASGLVFRLLEED